MRTLLHSILPCLLLLLSASVYAQKKLYFCSKYSEFGEPGGVSSSWVIKPEGGRVYMLYKNDGMKITTSTINIYIDKKSGGTYNAYATKTVTPDKTRSWVLYDHIFTEAGDYKVTFLDAAKNPLATEYCTILVKDKSNAGDYYMGSRLLFCEEVTSDGRPVTPSDVFNISSEGGFVYVLVDHSKSLNTTEIIVDIYTGEKYSKRIETKRIPVQKDQTWVKFKYTFSKPGNYKFIAYNKNETLINSGYITIERSY